ncbi:hypothetical protein H6504_05140 [Candidatus Woesearchaeota archaeon]|nr:hypothetical protein [Candidatus Woesearchaeota archaeon]
MAEAAMPEKGDYEIYDRKNPGVLLHGFFALLLTIIYLVIYYQIFILELDVGSHESLSFILSIASIFMVISLYLYYTFFSHVLQYFSHRPRLLFNKSGIYLRMHGVKSWFIAWSRIASIGIESKYIGLDSAVGTMPALTIRYSQNEVPPKSLQSGIGSEGEVYFWLKDIRTIPEQIDVIRGRFLEN